MNHRTRSAPLEGIRNIVAGPLTIATLSVALWTTTASGVAAAPQPASPDLFAVQFLAFSGQSQLLLGLQSDDASVAESGFVFTLGGIFGGAFLGGELYVAEADNGTSDAFLGVVPFEGPLVGQGARVGEAPIEFTNVEAITGFGAALLGASLDFPNHVTNIVEIDPGTGVGSLIGLTSRNVMIVGLAWDERNNVVYGAGIPFGSGEASAVDENNLYMIDPQTGAETLIGPLGDHLESLTWHPTEGLFGGFELLFSVDRDTGAATMVAADSFTNETEGNGLYTLAAKIVGEVARCGDSNDDTKVNATDALVVLQSAVNISPERCSLECDVNSSGGVNSTDALLVLQRAVNEEIVLLCP